MTPAARNCANVQKTRQRMSDRRAHQMPCINSIRAELTRGSFDGEYLRPVYRQGSLSDTHLSDPAECQDGISFSRRCILTIRPSRKLLQSTASRQRLAVALELWGSMRSRARSGTPCQQSCRCRFCWADRNTGRARSTAQKGMLSYPSVSQHARSGCNG